MGKSNRVISDCKHHGMVEHYCYGANFICAVCAREKKRARYAQNKDKISEYAKEWYLKNKEHVSVLDKKKRDRKKAKKESQQKYLLQKYEPTIKNIFEACGLTYSFDEAYRLTRRGVLTEANLIERVTDTCKRLALRYPRAKYSWTAATMSKHHHGLLVAKNGTTYSYYQNASEAIKNVIREETREYTELMLAKDIAPLEEKLQQIDVVTKDVENPLDANKVELPVINRAQLREEKRLAKMKERVSQVDLKLEWQVDRLLEKKYVTEYYCHKIAERYGLLYTTVPALRNAMAVIKNRPEMVTEIVPEQVPVLRDVVKKPKIEFRNNMLYGFKISSPMSERFFTTRFNEFETEDLKRITNLLIDNNTQMSVLIEKQAELNNTRKAKSAYGVLGVVKNHIKKDAYMVVTHFTGKRTMHGCFPTVAEAADYYDKLVIAKYGYVLASRINALNNPEKYETMNAVKALYNAGVIEVKEEAVISEATQPEPVATTVVKVEEFNGEEAKEIAVKDYSRVAKKPKKTAPVPVPATATVSKKRKRGTTSSFRGVQVREVKGFTKYICRLNLPTGKQYYKTFRSEVGAAFHYNQKMIEIYGLEKAKAYGLNNL
jgi:hypothetical protein